MEETVYIETSIVSYFTSRPSRDLVIAARQEVTHDIWPILIERFEIYISALVLQEISQGDTEAASRRLSAVSELPVLEVSQESLSIAKSLIIRGAIPSEEEEDALHIALTSINSIDFLLTWNFAHINNAFKKSRIVRVIEELGYTPPVICSPDEFLGEYDEGSYC